MDLKILYEQYFQYYGNDDDKLILCFAPGRVNLIGEHTDYNGGFVLPCALQFGTYLLIRKIEEPVIRLASINVEFQTEIPVSDIAAKVENLWINYPLGVFDQFRRREITFGGMELLYSGDIPNNAGLSSSASIEMVTAFALNELLHAKLSMTELIMMSQAAENQFVGVNCGIMDQFAVGIGAKGHAIFLNCMTLENKLVPLLLEGISMVIANTNKQRKLADSKYNERVAECQLAVTYLSKQFDISNLSEISLMQFHNVQDQIPDEVIRRRAHHVISENQRVLNSVACLLKDDILRFGELMNASHESLKENYEVTGFELDTLVEEAQKIQGVLGARMTGAGFGGCTVNLVNDEVVDQFIEEVGETYQQKTGLNADFYIAQVSEGARKIVNHEI